MKNALILTLIYILSLGICISVIKFVVIRKHIPAFEMYSLPMAKEYYDTKNLEDFYFCTMGALIYDKNGSCVDSRLPLNFESKGDADEIFGFAVKKAIPRAFQGKTVIRLCILGSEHAFFTIYGRVMYQDGQPVGTLFLVRYLPDLYGILFGVSSSITAIYLALMLCVAYVGHKKHKYSQMQNDYVANITHDLKSPVTSIKALSENLSLGVVEDEEVKQKYYTLLAKESVKLQHTIQAILELSAIQSDQTDFSKQQLKLADCFEPIIEKYRMLCDDMMIKFIVSETLAAIPRAYTNPKNITRLLDILLDNAVKFVGEDGIIRLDAVAEAKMVTICVRDNGIGISKENQAHIFDRFYMVDSSYNVNGSGLGLAIALGITHALHEKIWVESTLGEGTAFFFTVHMK